MFTSKSRGGLNFNFKGILGGQTNSSVHPWVCLLKYWYNVALV